MMNFMRILVFTVLMFNFVNSTSAFSGNSGGNGGELIGLHFTEASQLALEYINHNPNVSWIQKLNQELIPKNLSTLFAESINLTKLEVVQRPLFIGKEEKIAINYPDRNLIQVNSLRWQEARQSEQIAIAAHEHFGIIGIDDSNYRYSSQIIQSLNGGHISTELSVIAGRPNTDIEGLGHIVKQNIILNPEIPDSHLTTMLYSILKLKGVQSISNFQVLGKLHFPTSILLKGIQLSVDYSPVVLLPFDPMKDEALCDHLSKYPFTVFVMGAGANFPGSGAIYFNPPEKCKQKNIMFVTSLDKSLTNLLEDYSFGNNVTLAAPGVDIEVFDEQGRRSSQKGNALSITLVASAIAKYAAAHPALQGAKLVESFIKDETIVIPELSEKTSGGRAWLK